MGRVVCWMCAFLSPTTHSCSDNLRKLASAQRASQSMLCHIAGQCPMHFRTLILQSALLGRKNKYALVSKYGVLNRELFPFPRKASSSPTPRQPIPLHECLLHSTLLALAISYSKYLLLLQTIQTTSFDSSPGPGLLQRTPKPHRNHC
jgi:hypothetical protein